MLLWWGIRNTFFSFVAVATNLTSRGHGFSILPLLKTANSKAVQHIQRATININLEF